MKLSVLANLYGAKSLDETLSILKGLGISTVEIGAGGYPGKAHCNPEELLADAAKYDAADLAAFAEKAKKAVIIVEKGSAGEALVQPVE